MNAENSRFAKIQLCCSLLNLNYRPFFLVLILRRKEGEIESESEGENERAVREKKPSENGWCV